MKTKTIVGIVAVVAVVAGAVFFGNTKFQKGSLTVSSSGILTVSRDVVTNVKDSQVVAGNPQEPTDGVLFGAFKFVADDVEDILIENITIRNLGTNINGIINIGIYDGPTLINNSSKPALLADKSATFDYSKNPVIIPRNGLKVLTVRARTVYSATLGETVQFQIENIQGTGASSGAAITTGTAYDRTKILYPTKLNFAWATSAATSLTTGTQVEVARFTMGADAANVNNPDATITVSSLNFTNLSSARLTNFTLTLEPGSGSNIVLATNSNSANFNINNIQSTTIPQSSKIFLRILADASTNAGGQLAQFKFDAGSINAAGSATWTVSGNVGSQQSTWTDLGGLAEVFSPTLIAASSPSDSTPPTLQEIRLINKGVPGTLEIGDSIDLVFSEKLNPITINQSLTYGNTVNSVSAGATGTVTSKQDPTNSSLTFQIANIASFDLKQQASKPVKAPSTFGIKGFGKKSPQFGILIPPTTVSALPDPLKDALVDISINQAGHTVQLTFVGFNEKGNNVGYNLLQPQVGYSIPGTVKDAAGNALASGKTKVTGSW